MSKNKNLLIKPYINIIKEGYYENCIAYKYIISI